MASPIARLPLTWKSDRRRIDESAPNLGDVAETDHAAAGIDRNFEDVGFVLERAGNAQRQVLEPAVDDARRAHDVLRGDRREDLAVVEAHGGHAVRVELDSDLLVLRADEFDLADEIDVSDQRRAHILDIVAQFAMGEAVRREARRRSRRHRRSRR